MSLHGPSPPAFVEGGDSGQATAFEFVDSKKRSKQPLPPPMPMPDEGSMALWIDYGADAAAQAKFGAFARRLDARNWPESAGGEWAAERAIA